MVYDLGHRRVALLVIDVQREYFDPSTTAEDVDLQTTLLREAVLTLLQ
jgi:hypothetical protein